MKKLDKSLLIHPPSYPLTFLTHPPSPSRKTKVRGVTSYIIVVFILPLVFKGRVGEGLRSKSEEPALNEVNWSN
jgi:hypothetical protein